MFNSKKFIVILMLLFGALNAFATDFSIPASRTVTWTGNVGVKDGIPSRTTIYQTISATSGDRTSTIQTALNNCPSGQVVKLGAGTFNVTALVIPSNVTLRGSGMGTTTIAGTATGQNNVISFTSGGDLGTAVGLSSGLTKGSTSVTTSSSHGWSVGDVILIDQLEDPSGDPPIDRTGTNGDCTYCGRQGSGDRPIGQMVKLITGTSGTTANLEIPLYWAPDATKTPQGVKVTMGATMAGLEDLTLDNTTSQAVWAIAAVGVDNCWVTGVEINGVQGQGITAQYHYRLTLANNKIHNNTAGLSGDTMAIMPMVAGSAMLIENNIIYGLNSGIIAQSGMSGSAILYNYMTDIHQFTATFVRYGIGYHGGHCFANLIEGNRTDGSGLFQDNWWGSNGFTVIFRNRVNLFTGAEDGTVNIAVDTNNTYFSIIGNYLGTASQEGTYEVNTAVYYNPGVIYSIGYDASSYGVARSTMLRHGNWDSVTSGQKWCDTSGEPGCFGATASDHTFANSLYYTSKPSWYCDETTWPAVNPAGASDALRYSKIPAQIAYESGTCTLGGTPAATSGIYGGTISGGVVYR